MSNSLRPHRRQPTRHPRPWGSPGKNTGVGSHFLLQCMKVKSKSEVVQSCLTLRDPMDCSPPGSSVHGIFQARVLEWGAIAFSEVPTYNELMINHLKDTQIVDSCGNMDGSPGNYAEWKSQSPRFRTWGLHSHSIFEMTNF